MPPPPMRGRAQSTNPAMQRGRHEPSMRPVPDAAVDAVATTLREEGRSVSPTAGGIPCLQARAANEVLKAQERRIKVEKLKGTLVDVDKIKAALFRVARQERDAWQNWPSRVSALMAAELGADPCAMQTVLADHVRQHLSELADMVLKTE